MNERVVGDEEFENVDSGDAPRWLQAGIYPALWQSKTIKNYPGFGEKLTFTWNVFKTIHFREQELRMKHCVPLPAYYNLIRNKGGRLQFGPHSFYHKDWIAANDGRHPEPRHSLPLHVFQGGFLLVEVIFVTKDRRGPLPSTCQWSKVHRIIRPVREDEIFRRLPLQLDDLAK